MNHLRHHEPKAKNQPGDQSEKTLFHNSLHNQQVNNQALRTWRITKTVTAAVTIKINVAAIERTDKREIPQTPWPLVQPLPNWVPTPTNRPPIITSGVEIEKVTSGICPMNKPYKSGERIRPARKAIRHDISPHFVEKHPPNIPLIPATRPLNNIKIMAATPIKIPPINADIGVKFSITLPRLDRYQIWVNQDIFPELFEQRPLHPRKRHPREILIWFMQKNRF